MTNELLFLNEEPTRHIRSLENPEEHAHPLLSRDGSWIGPCNNKWVSLSCQRLNFSTKFNRLLGVGVGQNAQDVFEGVIKVVTRALFGRRAPLTPKLKRASARRREEKDGMGVYMIQQVAAERLG